MTTLKPLLERLDLSRYHDAFVDEGFDTWETLMDITESDLEALGVKLGHRRKLQRAIFNASNDRRPLPSPFQSGTRDEAAGSDEARKNRDTQFQQQPSQPLQNQDSVSQNGGQAPRSKRKYRRHPKPDEHAPERPPSAYVIFSNQIRDRLRGKDLSFTEIAKLVGERWQELQAHEKEPCEREAQALKDTYYSELRKYKKTPQYKQYQEYLVDFKAKHSENNGQDNKKPKLRQSGSSSQMRGYDGSTVDGEDGLDCADGADCVDGEGEDGMDGIESTNPHANSPCEKPQLSPAYSSPNTDSFRRFPIPRPPSDEGTMSSYSTWRSSQPNLTMTNMSHRQPANPTIATTNTTTTHSDDDSQSPSGPRHPGLSARSSGPSNRTSSSTTTLPSLTELESLSSRKSNDAPLLNWPLHTTLPPIDPRGIGQRSSQNQTYSPNTRYTSHLGRPLHPPPPPPPSSSLKDSLDLDVQNKASLSTLLRATEHVEQRDDGVCTGDSRNQRSSSRQS